MFIHKNVKVVQFGSRTRPECRRRGSVTLITAGALIMIAGFAALSVDIGISNLYKNKLQRTCDMAAMAGSDKLLVTGVPATDQANATAAAIKIAAANDVTITSSDISFPNNMTIRVNASKTRNFLFAPVMSMFSSTKMDKGLVNAYAIAGRAYVKGIPSGAVPIGITYATWKQWAPTSSNPNPGIVKARLTRNTQEKFGPLNSDAINSNTEYNIIGLDLRPGTSGNSGSLFQNDVTNGAQVPIALGDGFDPLGSADNSQGAKLENAINDRISRAAGAPWNDNGNKYSLPSNPPGSDNPRVMWVLVGDDGFLANNSNPKVVLKKYAPVYIDSIQRSNGNNAETYLSFRILPTGTLSASLPNITLGDGSFDTGVTVNRLLG